MKERKFNFSIATCYINSTYSEEVTLYFDEDATEDEIENQVNEIYTEWLHEKNYGTWSVLN